MPAKNMEELVALCKRRGFIFQSSEIYGGLQGTYDFGPLGVELKNNIKNAWWEAMVYENDDIEGLDSSILSLQTHLFWGIQAMKTPFQIQWSIVSHVVLDLELIKYQKSANQRI